MKLPNTVEPGFVKRAPSGSKKVRETGADGNDFWKKA